MCGGGVVASVECDLIGGKGKRIKHGELFQEAQEHVVVSRQSVNSSLKSTIFHGHAKKRETEVRGGNRARL